MKYMSDIIGVIVIQGIFEIALPIYVAYKYDIKFHEKTTANKLTFGILSGVVFILIVLMGFDISLFTGSSLISQYGSYPMKVFKYTLDIVICAFAMLLPKLFLIPRAVEKASGGTTWGKMLAVYLAAISCSAMIFMQTLNFEDILIGTVVFLFISSCSVLSRSIYAVFPGIFVYTFVICSSEFDSYNMYISWNWIFTGIGIAALSLGAYIFFSRRRLKARKMAEDNINLSV